MLEMRSEGDDGGGLVTHSGNQHQALTWNPQGKRKTGHPKNTRRRDLRTDIKRTGYSWREFEKKAQDRKLWKTVANDLCPRRGEG